MVSENPQNEAKESDIQNVETLTPEAYEAISELVSAGNAKALLMDLEAHPSLQTLQLAMVSSKNLAQT